MSRYEKINYDELEEFAACGDDGGDDRGASVATLFSVVTAIVVSTGLTIIISTQKKNV